MPRISAENQNRVTKVFDLIKKKKKKKKKCPQTTYQKNAYNQNHK